MEFDVVYQLVQSLSHRLSSSSKRLLLMSGQGYVVIALKADHSALRVS